MIEADSRWAHKHEGYEVQIEPFELGSLKVKSADGANWRDGVAYIRLGEPAHSVYVRAVDDFRAKFAQSDA